MGVAVKKLTWDDIKDLPEYHGRTEVVDGELVVSPVPALRHQTVCKRLGIVMDAFVKRHDPGAFYMHPVHVVLSEHVHYEPDLSFISKARLHICQEAFVEGPPDLVIEVISESNRTHDTVVKYRDYERYGVREYWLVDLREEHIRTLFLEGGKYVPLGIFRRGEKVATRVLAGLELDPAQVF